MKPTLHIELDGGVPPGDEERVSKLVDELDADWEVRRSGGVGVDPTSALVVIAVPFGIFVKKFLELAATDAYEAMKDWLVRLSQRRRAVEIRDLRAASSICRLTLLRRPIRNSSRRSPGASMPRPAMEERLESLRARRHQGSTSGQ